MEKIFQYTLTTSSQSFPLTTLPWLARRYSILKSRQYWLTVFFFDLLRLGCKYVLHIQCKNVMIKPLSQYLVLIALLHGPCLFSWQNLITTEYQSDFFVKFANGALPHKSLSDIVDVGSGSVGVQWRNELCLVQPVPHLLVTPRVGLLGLLFLTEAIDLAASSCGILKGV
jgi:hypothetical protein